MIRKLLVLLGAVFIGAGLLAPVAVAQYQPGQPGFILTPSTITPGATVTGIGFGCSRGEIVTFAINDQPVGTAITQGDQRGSFQGTFIAPSAPGTYVVTATCGNVIMSSILTIIAAPTSLVVSLPQTGSNATISFTRVGLALVTVGGLLVLATRRRRSAARA